MKAKNILLALGTVALATGAYAYTETIETMTVELNSGETVVYKVNDLNKVSFDSYEETIGFLITGADGEELYRSEQVTPLFRYAPEEDGANVQLLFGTADNAADLGGLKDGQYFVDVEMTNAGLWTENVNLAGDVTAAKVRLYEVTEGEISAPKEVVTEGTLSTSITAKGVVTMELDATFDDGFVVRASYKGSPVDVADLEALFPTPGPKNEIKYYNHDGALSKTTKIVGFKKTFSSYTGRAKYAVQFDDDNWEMKCEIEMKPEYIGQVINFAEHTEENSGAPEFTFRYEGIQVSGPNGEYRPVGLTGTMQVTENADGTITVMADVTNLYYNPMISGNGGTPERAVVEYTGACDGVEPKAKNNIEYYNQDGALTNTTAIPSFKKTFSSYTGRAKYAVQFDDDNWEMKCEIEMKPEYIGKVINFAEHTEENSGAPEFTFRYEGIQVAGPNGEYRPVGLTGTMQVTENADGTITVKADVANLYFNPMTSSNGGTPERAVIDFKGECSGL